VSHASLHLTCGRKVYFLIGKTAPLSRSNKSENVGFRGGNYQYYFPGCDAV